MSYIGMKELEQVPVTPSKEMKGPLSYDNCKKCASQCEHAGKDRTFCYRDLSCKITKKIDLVNVVRCKDCKYRGDYPCPMYYDELVEWDDDGYRECEWVDHDNTVDNGFCHMGERRDSDE